MRRRWWLAAHGDAHRRADASAATRHRLCAAAVCRRLAAGGKRGKLRVVRLDLERLEGQRLCSRQLRPGTGAARALLSHPEAQSMEDVVVAQWSSRAVGGHVGLRRLL